MAKKKHKGGDYGESGSSGAEGETHPNHAHGGSEKDEGGRTGMTHADHAHTGDIRHSDMVMHKGSTGMGGRDPHASEEHHKANKAHGMHDGFSPKGENIGEHHEDGGGMGGNCDYDD